MLLFRNRLVVANWCCPFAPVWYQKRNIAATGVDYPHCPNAVRAVKVGVMR
ncbi:hypothetical protein [Serratia microhaemolytica]|uniref:hypothetical protein n=1 Tax=Serratia microhaemolytica TaxID=2675110 RepID=UPI0012D83217|nr:hypothetical protein [Serratia microhaemolytica]